MPERSRQTAGHIAREGRLPYDHAWPELDELRPRALRASRPRWRRPDWLEGWAMARSMRRHARGEPVAGWPIAEVDERVRAVLTRLDALDEPRVAIVGHGFWILMVAVMLGGPRPLRWIHNCSVTRVDADGAGGYRLVSFAQRPDALRRLR